MILVKGSVISFYEIKSYELFNPHSNSIIPFADKKAGQKGQ